MVSMLLSDMRWTSQSIINNNVLNTTLFKHAPLKSNRIKRKCQPELYSEEIKKATFKKITVFIPKQIS